MTPTLYCFSGTGNSLHPAQELRKRLPDTHWVSMVRALDEGKFKSNADRVGLVFPIHCPGIRTIFEKHGSGVRFVCLCHRLARMFRHGF